MTKLVPSNRAAWSLVTLAILLLVIVGGLLIAKSFADAATVEADAKADMAESLRKRLALPSRPASPVSEENEFLEGGNYALAANALQQRIVGIIEAAGGTLVTVGIDPPSSDDNNAPGRRIVVQVVSELSNDALQEVLYQIETERPFVMVDTLNVRRLQDRGGADANAATQGTRLAVDFRAYGYFRRTAR
ncbi:MAG TPA: type II secretion system protein GspM [Pseudolabrys sp.]|jgi:hypothetical protein|nr:type II secretion system protein GspM [Pseudolabrys sp.]